MRFRMLTASAVLAALFTIALPLKALAGGEGGCEEGSDTRYSYNPVANRPRGLYELSEVSGCVSNYVEFTIHSDAVSYLFIVAPGAVRTFRRWGLQHLGLYAFPITGDGTFGSWGTIPCPSTRVLPNYLIETDGHVVVDPCAPPPGYSRRMA